MTAGALQLLALGAFLLSPASAQTYSSCNPLLRTDCPANPALGRSVAIDFTSGASSSFSAQGNPTYDSNGVSFTVAKSGDSPQLTSNWYIMFGKVEVSLKAAPGAGIVSSVVLQSDDLDEIDWEWLGADSEQVQTNFFGKGQTTTYNRGAFHPDSGSQSGFKTYTIEWTPEQIVWQINGVTVRALQPATADNQYPQTPMQLKFGAWSGGDPANSPGTIEWARGPTDYSKGPFTMQVRSISVSDYSTGKEYRYGDQSGTWQSIVAVDGKVNSGKGSTPIETAAPAITSTANGQPPHGEGDTTTVSRPSVYPWVPLSTTLTSATNTFTTYPGLPSGWTVSSSGKVIPPSSAPSTSPPAASTSSSSPQPSSGSAGGSEAASDAAGNTATPASSFITATVTNPPSTVSNPPSTVASPSATLSPSVLAQSNGNGSPRSLAIGSSGLIASFLASIGFVLAF